MSSKDTITFMLTERKSFTSHWTPTRNNIVENVTSAKLLKENILQLKPTWEARSNALHPGVLLGREWLQTPFLLCGGAHPLNPREFQLPKSESSKIRNFSKINFTINITKQDVPLPWYAIPSRVKICNDIQPRADKHTPWLVTQLGVQKNSFYLSVKTNRWLIQ
jgi:hypothetical protein